MSDEIKDKSAAETVAENLAATAQVIADTSPTAEEAGAAVEAVATAGTAKKGKAKGTAKEKQAKAEATGALRGVGLAACKRHGLACVWVTDDGQCFAQENDARAHGKNLTNPEPLKVEA